MDVLDHFGVPLVERVECFGEPLETYHTDNGVRSLENEWLKHIIDTLYILKTHTPSVVNVLIEASLHDFVEQLQSASRPLPALTGPRRRRHRLIFVHTGLTHR